MSGIRARLSSLRARIEAAAQQAGRAPEAVTLVGISKRQPLERLLEAYGAGLRDFGENTAQELRQHSDALAEQGMRPRWHFVGRLQRNKINAVLRHADCIQSVDSLDHAEAIAKRATQTVPILLQVNIGREAQKGGVDPQEALAFAEAAAQMPHLEVRGLMCVPPLQSDPTRYFDAMRLLGQSLRRSLGEAATELSMGMSQDFEAAVRAGATMVRIGTALFGERDTVEGATHETDPH